MNTGTQETKIENLRIHAQAKSKVHKCADAIHRAKKIQPSLSETITIICDHYLATGKAA